jgi:hypothetical protein
VTVGGIVMSRLFPGYEGMRRWSLKIASEAGLEVCQRYQDWQSESAQVSEKADNFIA